MPVDFILQLTLDSLNGLHNDPTALGATKQADPEFFRALTMLREIQEVRALGALAKGVELPPSHLVGRLTPPFAEPLLQDALLLRVHGGSAKPAAAYAVVPCNDEWFWIADDDWKSKRTFTSILFVLSLAETSASNNLPALTIPTR